MMHVLLCSLFIMFFGTQLSAQSVPLVADISSHQVQIHSGFTGTQLMVFGARNDTGDIVVAIRGPARNVVVREKKRTAGIWVNRAEQTFNNVPQFYAIASNKPLSQVRQFHLFEPLMLQDLGQLFENHFYQALVRILAEQEVYNRETGRIDFIGETLFKASFDFPDNMPRGIYTAEVYLFNNGMLVGVQSIPIDVYKTGFDAFIYDAAIHHSTAYGLIAVMFALAMGWAANWLFRRI